jgi:hypothetical protein
MVNAKRQLFSSLLASILSRALAVPGLASSHMDTFAPQTNFVDVYSSSNCGDNTYLIQIGVVEGSVGSTNCPMIPTDQIFDGQRPDGTLLVYLSPPSQIFEAGKQLAVRTSAVKNENQCGIVSQTISQPGCFPAVLEATFLLQSCVDPKNCAL